MEKKEYKPRSSSGGARSGGGKPFKKAGPRTDRTGSSRTEGGAGKSFGRRDEGGEKRSYARAESGEKRSYGRGEGGDKKPYARTEGGYKKPAYGKSEGGYKKPAYGKREEGSDKPAYGRSEGGYKKTAYGKTEEGFKKPAYGRREEGSDKPAYGRSEGGYKKPAYGKSEGGYKKPAFGRKDDGERKPGFGKRDDKARPAYGRKTEEGAKPSFKRTERGGKPAFEKKTFRDKPAFEKKTFRDKPENEAYIAKPAVTEEDDDTLEERNDRIEGRNPVFEALKSDRPLNKIFIEKDSGDSVLARIVALAREREIPIQFVDRRKLDMLSTTRIHQGVILEAAAHEYVEVDEILNNAAQKGEDPFIVVLDSITDTNNMGSIIRSAECAGVHGIIIPKRRSATLNATVAKVAAGAQEFVPVARVSNLAQTIRELKEKGIWITGADMAGEKSYAESDLKGPIALVIGSEGEGISRIVKEECDYLVKIPLKGKISSLNAGVAAALIMFEISKKRG